MERLSLTEQQWMRMRSHVDSCLPLEACGLLAGEAGIVREVLPIRNKDLSATGFLMDPLEQLKAFNWIETQGLELVGIYHSHPAGPEASLASNPGPSPTDIARAAYPVAHVIWSRPQGKWQARAFRIEAGRAFDVQLLIGRGQ